MVSEQKQENCPEKYAIQILEQCDDLWTKPVLQ